MNFRGKHKPEPVGFQIAPMIDVVFLLLCFFVTSQVFTQWESEIDIALPTARTAEFNRRLPGEIILNIRTSGEVAVSGRVLNEGELSSLLDRLVKLFPGQPVLIRADRETPYRFVIRVLDLCRKSEIWNISFATLPGEEPAKVAP
jgi:biopolymer transport protein ExbD